MCDPVSITVGLIGGAMVSEQRNARKASSAAAAAQAEAQVDPAAERAKAEAEAAQRANAQLADTQRRRREQQSLLAKGGTQAASPTFSLGDSELATAASPITSPRLRSTNRSTVARQSSLMARGGTVGGGSLGGGGGGGYTPDTALM